MTKEEIEARLIEISGEIIVLKSERHKLEQDLLATATTWEDKFRIWYDNADGMEERWMPDRKEYPALRKMLDRRDLDRHRTYDILEYFQDDICHVMFGETPFSTYSPEKIEDVKAMCKEIMEKNIISFKCDW